MSESSNNGEPPGVYRKMRDVMERIERIPKTGRNERFNYDFVEEQVVLERLRPIMTEVGLLCIPSQHERTLRERTTNRGGTMYTSEIRHSFRFVDPDDGSEVTVHLWGEGEDSTDKGPYKALVGTLKYALLKTFQISTGDDPERANGGPVKPSGRKGSEPQETGDDVPDCPECGGPMWDNRPKKASGAYKSNAPDFKCKDKECDTPIWSADEDEGDSGDEPPNTEQALQRALEDGDATARELMVATLDYVVEELYAGDRSAAKLAFRAFAINAPDRPDNIASWEPEDWRGVAPPLIKRGRDYLESADDGLFAERGAGDE